LDELVEHLALGGALGLVILVEFTGELLQGLGIFSGKDL